MGIYQNYELTYFKSKLLLFFSDKSRLSVIFIVRTDHYKSFTFDLFNDKLSENCFMSKQNKILPSLAEIVSVCLDEKTLIHTMFLNKKKKKTFTFVL